MTNFQQDQHVFSLRFSTIDSSVNVRFMVLIGTNVILVENCCFISYKEFNFELDNIFVRGPVNVFNFSWPYLGYPLI